ncbi:MAG: ROK family protein [Actinomycetota bacterium]|nr:ROK family protein [Actinomycetota bacterium]
MSAAGAQAIGVDIGGTKTAAVRIAADGSVSAREVRPTPADDMSATLDTMVETARAVLDPEVRAVGIAAAGLVESGSGVLRFAPNLAWRDARLVEFVGAALELPTVADNDATAAVWGEFRCGAGQGHEHVLYVGVGTGIGGGVVAGGRLLRGAHGFAAEIGHVIVEPGGHLCGCGNRGCWETVASGSTILRDGRRAISRHSHSMLVEIAGGDPARVTGEMVTEAALAGDATARGIIVEVGHRLGEGIAGLVNILDPEVVVVGGGALAAGDLLLEPARAAFLEAVEAPDHRPEVPIVAAALGNDAGGVGAALLALEALG